MNKKNMLGMDLKEWKHLSGLSDPYALALAEVAAEAGVPAIVEARGALADLPDSPLDVHHGDDEPAVSASAQPGKASRLAAIKKVHRLRRKSGEAAAVPASERHKVALELSKHRKAFGVKESLALEGVEVHVLWAAFLEDRGTSPEEFNDLLDLAIESEDEDLAIELLAVEAQLDELLGAIGQGAMKVGQGLVKGAQAVGRTALGATKGLANAAGQVVGSAAKGVTTGFAPKPAAGGGAPAGATPPAGAPPAAPAGASPQAAPAAAATPAAAAVAPTAPAGGAPAAPAAGAAPVPAKPGLLGTLARGVGKVAGGIAKGVGGMAGSVVKGAKAGYQAASMDMDDFADLETFLGEEFGLSAEEYVNICDRAFETGDTEMIESAHQLDEIFAAWRAKKAAAAQEKHEKGMAAVKAAADVIKTHGAGAVKKASQQGKGIPATKAYSIGPEPKKGGGTTLNQSMESVEDVAAQIMASDHVPKAKVNGLKELMGDQLRFSGYTDEYLNEKYMGFSAVKAAAAKSGARNPAAVAAAAGRKKYGKAKFQSYAAKGKSMRGAKAK